MAISAVGVVGSDDAGKTWRFMNNNIRADFLPTKYPEYGQCVHKIDHNLAKPDTLYLQNHGGIYASKNFGDTWSDIGKGLPSDFGFPIGVHPHKADTVYVVPLDGETRYPSKGKFQVWVSRDGGGRWVKSVKGLPSKAYFNVLREAMSFDQEDPCGIYIGTSGGQLYQSIDEGISWTKIADNLPRIHSVSCVTIN
ncbi:MAG: hypothetical protein HYU39_00820 [Thaumarchaeota archaeon]|nr:hypothetical protein [Nitrososphaerota archaeon]